MTYATEPGVAAEQAIDPRRYHEAADPNRSPTAPGPPVCLYLEVTNRCNLLCTTCPRTYADLEPPADMDWDRFRSIVDQLPNLKRAVLAWGRRADAGEASVEDGRAIRRSEASMCSSTPTAPS